MIRHSKNQQVSISPQVLEVHGDQVLFDMKASIPREMLRKKTNYALAFKYSFGLDQEESLGRVNFKPGEFLYEEGCPTINRQFFFTYQPEKNPGTLWVQGIASRPGGRKKRTPWQPIASGLVTTSKLIARSNTIELEPDTYLGKTMAHNSYTFYFDKGQARLSTFFGSRVPVLKSFVEANIKTRSVEITAGISPEPEELKNPRLASQRVKTVELYYRQLLDMAGYENTNKTVRFTSQALPGPWGLFLKKIQHSALPEAEIEQILDIVNGPGSSRQKEAQLARLPASDYLNQYVYPMLRFAEVKIAYTPLPRKDYEIYLLSKKITADPASKSLLSQEELRYAASLTPLLKEKQQIYEAAVANSDHWQAYHNLGVVYLQQARLETRPAVRKALYLVATRNLTFASHRQPTARNFYHLASAQHLQGNLLEAMQAYEYAIKLGGPPAILQAVFADKAALEIESGQIEHALQSLRYAGTSYQNYINKGLCYLLKENYQEAAALYAQAASLQPQEGLAYYSQAVLAARQQNEAELQEQLQKAVQADRRYIRRAIEDPEFKSYLGKEAIRSALK